jgi:hypothetical protein
MVVGTTGMDILAIDSLSSDILVQANWNAQKSERRTYSKSAIGNVQIYLLGGDDYLSVNGTVPVALDIRGGMGNDWLFVQSLAATITDMHGDNVIRTGLGDDVIHTGTGNDEIDAGGGKNQIQDDGGLNTITTGDDDDKIWHSNKNDWIVANDGTNDIWLNGVHQDWHNETQSRDVNRDGYINAIDVLVMINKINRLGPGYLHGSADSVQSLYDVNKDNYINSIDILQIINWLNQNQVGEGESSSDNIHFDDSIDFTIESLAAGRSSKRVFLGIMENRKDSEVKDADVYEGKKSLASPSRVFHEVWSVPHNTATLSTENKLTDPLAFDLEKVKRKLESEYHDMIFRDLEVEDL